MQIREIKRPGKCRGCRNGLSIGDTIFFHSSCCTDDVVIFCVSCMKQVKEKVQTWEKENE